MASGIRSWGIHIASESTVPSIRMWLASLRKHLLIVAQLVEEFLVFYGTRWFIIFQVEFFWVVTPSSVVVRYQRFRGPFCFYGPLKRWYPTTTLHGVTIQKKRTWNITAVKATELAFIILFTRISIWILSLASWIQSTPSFNLDLQRCLFRSGYPTNMYAFSRSTCVLHIPCILCFFICSQK